jgi:hypothetical protein
VHPETEAFIHDLFKRCFTQSQQVFLTLTAIHPDGDKPTPSRHIPLSDTTALEQAVMSLCKANEQGWGAYIGVAPRQLNLGRWTRGGKTDLACLPALFADLDQPEHALLHLESFDLSPSCILKSGCGYHAYWFLEQPTNDFAQADQVLHGLAQSLNADEVLSVAQSMRLPGTRNTKAGREGTMCHFVSYHPERLYDFSVFRAYLPQINRNFSWQSYEHEKYDLPRSLVDTLTLAVLHQLDGHWRSNGYIAACCPFPHVRDRPGMHFSYNAESGWGYCFGKHGKIAPVALCRCLGVLKHDLDPLWSATVFNPVKQAA